MAMQECCFKGFEWNGTPTGREGTLGKQKAYIAGDNKDYAVLIGHDALGWEWKNTRLLADHFAKEVGATAYLPDFFEGYAVGGDDIKVTVDESGNSKIDVLNKDFDMRDWLSKNTLDVRMPQVLECAKLLREQYSWVGYTGYCWGGGVGFRVASSGLVDSVTVAHSATPTEEEVHSISVPFQILAAEFDPTFPTEVKDMCNREIPKLGVPYVYHHFPGMVHGFATKCADDKANEKKALELAKNAVVFWMNSHKPEK